MNLVELAKNQLSGEVAGRLGGLLGTSPDQTRSAVDAAVPTLLAGFGKLAESPDGARKLEQAVDNADEGILSKATQAVSGDGGSLANFGNSLLGSLFGNNMISGIGSALSKFTGLGSGAISSLLGALTPMLLGMLKGKKNELGLNSGGLANLLAGQKNNIQAAMPAGLGTMLGNIPGIGALSGMGAKASNVASNAYDASRDAVERSTATAAAGANSAARWAIPALIIAALGLGLWWLMKDRSEPPMVNVPSAPKVDLNSAMPAGANISADALTSAQDKVNGFFKSTTEAIGGITDAASAEAALPKLRDLSTKFDSVQTTFNALPADARTQVKSLFETSLDKLKPAIDKVLGLPGVADKIKPVTDELLKKAYTLAGKPLPA